MSGLVGYGSSDDEDEVQDERPAKVAKTTHKEPEVTAVVEPVHPAKAINTIPTIQPQPNDTSQSLPEATAGPAPGPSIQLAEAISAAQTPISAPSSPYSHERQRIRELTMPTVPDFDIPASPSPPARNSEEAAALAATTKKFERFLELKKQGVHFNQRLENTASLRNPSLLPKLMEFAGISKEESYASTLTDGMELPGVWPEQVWPENLVKINERLNRKRVGEREKVEFVAATRSGASSKSGTPGSGAEGRRSKFDKR